MTIEEKFSKIIALMERYQEDLNKLKTEVSKQSDYIRFCLNLDAKEAFRLQSENSRAFEEKRLKLAESLIYNFRKIIS